jgi:uncharacterized delta-60 repeat protein
MTPSYRGPYLPIFVSVLFILITGLVVETQGQQIQVTAADPTAAEQGTVNLNVKVTGKGFKNGAKAKWFVTGTTDSGGVTVNSTTFVSSTEVSANITVADSAVIANFDIQVLNSDGRGGKGTELFAVTAKGNNVACPAPQPAPTGDTRCYDALPGCLDSTFGGGVGFVNTHLGDEGTTSWAWAVAVQPDGKIITAGDARNSLTLDDVAVTRFNSDGSLDTSFGDPDPLNPPLRLGYVVTFITAVDDTPRSIALQPDGKIVLVGDFYDNRRFGFVVRYNLDGTPDSGFGSNGVVILDFGRRVASPHRDVAIQADGKILAGGAGLDGFAVARLLPNGSVDTSFGSGGLVAANPSGTKGGASAGWSMTLQRVPAVTGEERVVLGGSSKTSSGANQVWTLMRFRSNGAADTSFGISGVVKTTFFGSHDIVHALTIDYSNRIVAAGNISSANADSCGGNVIDYGIVRYNENGTMDLTFAGGKQTVDFYGGRDEMAYDVVVQPDDKILASGTAMSFIDFSGFTVHNFGLVRFNVDGSRDSSFGLLGNGLVTTDFFGTNDLAISVALQPADGRIVVAGATAVVSGPALNIAVARYWP